MNKMYLKQPRAVRLISFFIATSMLWLVSACSSNAQEKEKKQETSVSSPIKEEVPPAFPSPDIPMTLQDPAARAEYFIEHFWDNCTFDSKELMQHSDRLEQSVANLLGIVSSFPSNKSKDALLYPLEHSTDSLFTFFTDNYKRYLYEPNSPFFNEELYLPIVEYLTSSPKVSLATKERAKFKYALLCRNRVGEQAEDFSFITSRNEQKQLSDFRGRPTILFFYTPGCHSCEAAMAQLASDMSFQSYIQSKRLNLLFIDAENDIEQWQESIATLPSFGVIGFNKDGRVTDIPLYDLKASPTIYLLDKEGKVWLKDISVDRLLPFLEEKLL